MVMIMMTNLLFRNESYWVSSGWIAVMNQWYIAYARIYVLSLFVA